jgi:hypothetical protein
MEAYNSTSGKKSGVIGYEIGEDFILVQFRGNTIYKYSYTYTGANQVETMKGLALNQNGLSTFIAQNKPNYESKY